MNAVWRTLTFMAGCCDPRGCEEEFGDRFARQMARKYRRRGLDDTASWMVDFLSGQDVDGATVLEVGGGVGEIGIELARRGAASVTTVELSDAYTQLAARLATDAGVADHMHRRLVDIAVGGPGADADDAGPLEPADIVVLHRVVCCYPDFGRLLGASARLCRDRLAFSHPPRNLISRCVIAAQNTRLRAVRREFRAFAHPPAQMVAVLEDAGLRWQDHRDGLIWQAEAFAR